MIGLHTSLGGILRGVSRLEASAGRIAAGSVRGASALEAHAGLGQGPAPADRVELSREALEMLAAEHQVAVNARVLGRLAETQDALFESR